MNIIQLKIDAIDDISEGLSNLQPLYSLQELPPPSAVATSIGSGPESAACTYNTCFKI